MKKAIITLTVLLTTIICFSQSKKDSTVQNIQLPADSVSFISIDDIDAFLKWLPENVSKANYDKMKPEEVIVTFYRWALAEWNRKQKLKK